MVHFNTASLKAHNETGIPLSVLDQAKNNGVNDLDQWTIRSTEKSEVSLLGQIHQGYLNKFKEESHKAPGFVGYRLRTVNPVTGGYVEQPYPFIYVMQHLLPSIEAGLVKISDYYRMPGAREEDRIAAAFGVSGYGVNNSHLNNIAAQKNAYMTSLASYLLNNRRSVNLG